MRINNRRRPLAWVLMTPALFLLALSTTARAEFVSGEFAPGGTSVEVTGTEILFYNLGVTVTPPTGQFKVNAPGTGSFASLLGSQGTITDLTTVNPDPSCSGCIFAPVDTALGSNTFITLPGIVIELTGVSAGIDTAGTPLCSTLSAAQLSASGTQCTPAANSPFVLQNVLNSQTGKINTNLNFSASGSAWFTVSPTQVSTAALNFSTSFTNQTIGQILADIAVSGGVVGSLQGDIVVTAPAAPFTGCTVTQGGWGAAPHGNNPGAFLVAHFPTATGVTIGTGFPNAPAAPFWLHFNAATNIQAFLPQGGPPGALSASAINPTARTTAGVFAGQVLALTLNAQLQNFGSLVLSGTGTSLDGSTVAQVLAAADVAISGGPLPAGFTYSSLNDLVDSLNSSFDGCVGNSFATGHLH